MTQQLHAFDLAIASLGFALAAVAVPSDLGAQDTTAVLIVTVSDHGSGEPVSGATVEVDGGAYGAVTNGSGRARITGLPPGIRAVAVQAFGFKGERFSAHFGAGATVEADMALLVGPITLDPIRVEAVAAERRLRRIGFYERQRRGLGTIIPPEEVEQMARRSVRLIDAFRGVPGLRVIPVSTGYTVVSSRGPTTLTDRHCSPEIHLDGARQQGMAPSELENLIPLTMVAAIEVYPSSATTPPEFFSSGHCGAILIWTK